MEKYDQRKSLVQSLSEDFYKFYGKGNNPAGTRLRKGMQSINALAQEIRTDVQSKKQSS